MSITSYSELKTAVANWVARDDLTTYIPDFITLGESRIYRELRVRQMEAAISSTISSGVISTPSGYVEMKHLYIDGSPARPLDRVDITEIYNKYPTRSTDAKPHVYAVDAGSVHFGPYPDSAYTVKGTYFKKLDALSDSNTSNWLITDHPDLILAASLVEAIPFIHADDRLMVWEGKYQAIKNSLMLADARERYSGSPLRARPS